MSRSLLLLAATLLPGAAFAQSAPKLPAHGWVRADFDVSSVTPKLTLGGAFALSRVTAMTLEGTATDTAATVAVGASVEIGALYLDFGVGPEIGYTGGMGVGGDARAVVEIPPLPIYWEGNFRPTFRSPFGGADDWTDRNLLLWTFGKAIAAGYEHDGLHAITAGTAAYDRHGVAANIRLCKPAILGLFVGYEADANARSRVEVGPDWLAAQATLTFAF